MGYFCSKTNQMHNISNLFHFVYNTLHVSEGLSVHHQESKTIHTASGVCQTGLLNITLYVSEGLSVQHQEFKLYTQRQVDVIKVS